MHENSIGLTPESGANLIRSQFPKWSDQPLQWLEVAGTANMIIRIGERFVARFPLRFAEPSEVAEVVQYEAKALKELAASVSVSVPSAVALGKPGLDYPLPWSVQTWISGQVATPTNVATSQRFTDDLAVLINELRQTDTQDRQFSGNGRGGALKAHDEWMDTCFHQSQELLDVPLLRRLWHRFRELPHEYPDAMTHGDLIPGNILLDKGRLSGLLDGGGFGPADPALDLVSAWHLLDKPLRARLRTSLNCSDLEWQRGAAWAFQQAMGLVWYYCDSHPTMRDLGLRSLHRIQSDEAICGSPLP